MFNRKYISILSALVIPIASCFSGVASAAPAVKNLQTFDNEEFKTNRKLYVEFVNLPACHIGDLDLIRRELMTSEKPAHLIFTIEPISPKAGITPISISFPESSNGKVAVTLDENMKDEALGLFLCKVTDGKPLTCADKKNISFEEMYKPYEHLVKKFGLDLEKYEITKKDVSDKTYYFTPLFYDGDSLTSFSDRPSEDTYKELKEKYPAKSAEIEDLKKRDSTLKSYSPIFMDDRIVVRLPSFSPEKCTDD